MKCALFLTTVGAVALLGVSAHASSPPTTVQKLERRIGALERKIDRLESEKLMLVRMHGASLNRAHQLAKRVAGIDTCPITRPNASIPPGSTFGSEFHGNGSLWVGLWEANVVVWEREADGSIDAKFGWWRKARGRLEIDGRRVDAPAPPLRAHIPDGYGDRGFQATGIIFPTTGCWEVTGRVGNASLTFVTLVLAR